MRFMRHSARSPPVHPYAIIRFPCFDAIHSFQISAGDEIITLSLSLEITKPRNPENISETPSREQHNTGLTDRQADRCKLPTADEEVDLRFIRFWSVCGRLYWTDEQKYINSKLQTTFTAHQYNDHLFRKIKQSFNC